MVEQNNMITILDPKISSADDSYVVDLTPRLSTNTSLNRNDAASQPTQFNQVANTTRKITGSDIARESISTNEVKDVSFNKVSTGTLQIDREIYSPNYVAGLTGWKIWWDGSAEFNNVTVRGVLEAGEIHIPNSTTANSFHTDTTGNSWWWCTPASFTTNNNNSTAYILKNGNARFAGTLNVEGTTRLANTLTLGSAALQKSGKMVMEYYPSDGDTYIRAGKLDFGDNTLGFIIGIDQSDSGQVKAEFGDTSNYVKILPTGIFIRSNNADLTGSSTIAGKLTTVLVAQTDTKEELVLRPVDSIDEIEIQRADGTVVDVVQGMGSSGTPCFVTDFTMYGKTLTKSIYFQFDYSMSTSETSHQVKLQVDFNVISNSGLVNPSSYTGTVTQELTVLNSADYRELVDTSTGTLKIDQSYLTSNSQLVQIRISRINTGLIGTNHGGSFRIHRIRAYMA